MTGTAPTSKTLMSEVSSDGVLTLSLEDVPVRPPNDDQIVVRVEAAPMNPSDLWLLLGPADLTTLRQGGTAADPTISADIPRGQLEQVRSRWNRRLPVGVEGAGTVVDAGHGARHLIGRRVSFAGGGTFTELRTVKARDCVVLPPDFSAEEGAALYVNPMTALAMIETCRLEGHTALIHTAAASNLGQILHRVCAAEKVGLVNIVRTQSQASLLHGLGAAHVVNSTSGSFHADLNDAVAATDATLAFDAVGGGDLADSLLSAMESAALRKQGPYSPYGSQRLKQVYVYGSLDRSPTTIDRTYGMAWAIGGFLLPWFLDRIGPQETARLRQRVVSEARSTFATRYAATVSLAQALKPDVVLGYARRATGGKYLVDPSRGHG